MNKNSVEKLKNQRIFYLEILNAVVYCIQQNLLIFCMLAYHDDQDIIRRQDYAVVLAQAANPGIQRSPSAGYRKIGYGGGKEST